MKGEAALLLSMVYRPASGHYSFVAWKETIVVVRGIFKGVKQLGAKFLKTVTGKSHCRLDAIFQMLDKSRVVEIFVRGEKNFNVVATG
jgi:hypothetical protein